MIGLKIYLGQCNLHFMVQLFCLITRRLFDEEMTCLEYKFHVTGGLTSKYTCIYVSISYISWSIVLTCPEYYFMEKVIPGMLTHVTRPLT